MTDHRIRIALRVGTADRAETIRKLDRATVLRLGARWTGVPATGAVDDLRSALQTSINNEDHHAALLKRLSPLARQIAAAAYRFGPRPLTSAMAAGDLAGVTGELIGPTALRRHRAAITTAINELVNTGLWVEEGSSYRNFNRFFTPVSEPGRVVPPWSWQPLKLPTAPAPQQVVEALAPALTAATVVSAVIAVRAVKKPFKKDGDWTAAHVTAFDTATAGWSEAVAAARGSLDIDLADHWLPTLVQNIAFGTATDGTLVDWASSLKMVGAEPEDPADQLATLWSVLLKVIIACSTPLPWYGPQGLGRRHPLRVAEVALQLALADHDWVDAVTVWNYLSACELVCMTRPPFDDWVPRTAIAWANKLGMASHVVGERPKDEPDSNELVFGETLLLLWAAGWFDLGVSNDRLLLRPSVHARWVARGQRPAQRMAPMVDGSGQVMVDPVSLAPRDAALLGAVGDLVGCSPTLLTFRVNRASVARGLALGVDATTLDAELTRIAGRKLDGMATSAITDETRRAGRYELVDKVDVTIAADGSFVLSPTANQRTPLQRARIAADGRVQGPATDDAVLLTRLERMSELRGKHRHITANALRQATLQGMPGERLGDWLVTYCSWAEPGHAEALQWALQGPHSAGRLVHCDSRFMAMVLRELGIRGVTPLGADTFFVPDTLYATVAAALEQRGVMPPGSESTEKTRAIASQVSDRHAAAFKKLAK